MNVLILHIVPHITLHLLEVILQHPSHSVEFVGLLVVELVFVLLLFFLLSFFFDLLVKPLFLFVFEELPSGIVLWIREGLLRSSPSNSRQPERKWVSDSVGKLRKYVYFVLFMKLY